MVDYKKYSEMDSLSLDKKISSLRREFFELRMLKVAGNLEKPHKKKEIRKEIARALTAKHIKGINK